MKSTLIGFFFYYFNCLRWGGGKKGGKVNERERGKEREREREREGRGADSQTQ